MESKAAFVRYCIAGNPEISYKEVVDKWITDKTTSGSPPSYSTYHQQMKNKSGVKSMKLRDRIFESLSEFLKCPQEERISCNPFIVTHDKKKYYVWANDPTIAAGAVARCFDLVKIERYKEPAPINVNSSEDEINSFFGNLSEETLEKIAGVLKIHRCSFCDKSFKSKSGKSKHMNKFHAKPPLVPPEDNAGVGPTFVVLPEDNDTVSHN